jgi:hypothetical protein
MSEDLSCSAPIACTYEHISSFTIRVMAEDRPPFLTNRVGSVFTTRVGAMQAFLDDLNAKREQLIGEATRALQEATTVYDKFYGYSTYLPGCYQLDSEDEQKRIQDAYNAGTTYND